jgi:hypothetical protein
VVLAAALQVAVAAPPASGQTDEDVVEETGDLASLQDMLLTSRNLRRAVRFRMDSRFVPGQDFGASDTDIYAPRGRMRLTIPLSQTAVVRFNLSGGTTLYNWDDSINLMGTGPQSSPFDELNHTVVGVQVAKHFENGWKPFDADASWSIFAQGNAAFAWEGGAEFDDSVRGSGAIAGGFHIPDVLDLVLGIGLSSRLDRSSPTLFPVISFKWYIDENWTLRSTGRGLSIERKFGENLVGFVRGRFESRTYRLDARAGPTNRGTLRDRQLPVGLGVRWRINRHFRLTAMAGVLAYHQLRTRNRNRDDIVKVTGDPAPYFQFRIDMRP